MVPRSRHGASEGMALAAKRGARAITERGYGATWRRKVSEWARNGAASSAACERSEWPAGEQKDGTGYPGRGKYPSERSERGTLLTKHTIFYKKLEFLRLRQLNKAHSVILFLSPTTPQYLTVAFIKDYYLKGSTATSAAWPLHVLAGHSEASSKA